MIHIVSLPHTLLTREYEWCAFTAKVWRLTKMMSMAKNPVTLYGPNVVDAETLNCAHEYVTIVDDSDRMKWFGSAEWPSDKTFDRWDSSDPCWTTTNERAAAAIRERWSPGDVVGIIGGRCQEQILDLLSDLKPMSCEWGIGYGGVIDRTHKVYESYAWMHHIAGKHHKDDIRYFDAVIPNCYDTADFKPRYEQPKDPYLLFMARPIARKGIDIVADIAKRTSIPIKIAGQPGVKIPGTEHVGVVTGPAKYELLANATALLSPTVYLEPFGGVAIEAMMSGTPVIATDWGAYTETIRDSLTGFRCRMLSDFLTAIEKVPELNRRNIAYYAEMNYSLAEGSMLYRKYFERLNTLYSDGWYTL